MTQLTKREQIAAMVLQGYVSSPDYAILRLSPDEWEEHRMNMAIGATELADSLLNQLAETEPNLQPETRSVFHEMLDMIEGSRPAVVFTHENPEATGQVVNDNKHPMNTEDIVQWVIRNVGLSFEERDFLKHHINALVAYEVNKAKQ